MILKIFYLGQMCKMKLFADDAKLYSSFVYLSGDLVQ